MMKFVVALIRLCIIALLLLPLFVPTVTGSKPVKFSRNVTIVSNKKLSQSEKNESIQKVRNFYGQNATIRLQDLSSETKHPVQVFDEVGQAIKSLSGIIILDLENSIWGDTAARFKQKVQETDAAQSGRLFKIENASPANEDEPKRFLMIADIYVPNVTFLGEETLAVIEVSGKLSPNETRQTELVIRSNSDLVSTIRQDITADESGYVSKIFEIPVSFLKAQTQILNVALKADDALEPFDSASTTVFVAHGKTTILHVAVGPDWSVRTMRQKLKFWPNLDLLSYYILRERFDDNTIPPNQLSLIEFPADKLFGEQLPNFHGIIAQNFYFDHYLGQKDSLNLVQYVRDGGRMFLQAGPLSFLSQDPAINVLFPCQNAPEFVTDAKPIAWKIPKNAEIKLPSDLSQNLSDMHSAQYFKNCKPKENVFVLAELSTGEPILTASNLDKGLVVTSLAADWHTFATRQSADSHSTPSTLEKQSNKISNPSAETSTKILTFNQQTAASERLTNWIIEFLQRRQDSGLRPPDLAGPRLFREDRFALTRTRGALRQDTPITLFGSKTSGKAIQARTVTLPFLEKEGLELDESFAALAPFGDHSGHVQIDIAIGKTELQDASDDETNQIRRGGAWPLFSRALATAPAHPTLLSDVPNINALNASMTSGQENNTQSQEERPLLEVYPFLVALALGLLCLDTFLTHILSSRNPNQNSMKNSTKHSKNNLKPNEEIS